MCITRVGKVLSTSGSAARVEFFDGRSLGQVDISMLKGVARGGYVEVYGNLAMSVLSTADARRRRAAWKEIRRAAMLPDEGSDLV